MSLDAVKAVLDRSQLNTYNLSLQTDSAELYAAMTRKAQLFLGLLADVPISGGNFTLEELLLREWGDVESFFWSLDTDVQLEILGALTVSLHEWVHYLDLLATPFGVNLTIKHTQEFILFQELAPFLLTQPDKTLAEPLADWLTKTSEPGWLLSHQNEDPHSFDALRQGVWGKMAFDDYVTGSVPRRVTPGWGGVMLETEDDYVPVTVNRVWPALRHVSDPTTYIGPFELLEGRALTMCLCYLRHSLGHSTDATGLVREYVGTFYASQPRYTRILEYLAGESLNSALSKQESAEVDNLLLIAQALTWYALYGAPPLKDDDVFAAMPTFRFLVAVIALRKFHHDGVVFPSVAEMLDNIDQSELAKETSLGTSNNLLIRTVNASGRTAQLLQSVSNKQSMVDCYMRLLGAQGLIVQARVGQGYACGYGWPEDGNPLKAGDKALGQALKALEPLHGELNEWVQSRNRIFFARLPNPQERVDEVRKWSC